MSDPDHNDTDFAPAASLDDERLKPQLERLGALRSAWGALAPSGGVLDSRKIASSGRDVTERLEELAGRSGDFAPGAIEEMDRLLDEFEGIMRRVAIRVPVSQLRSNLPELIGHDRRALLDLLDVMIGGLPEEADSFSRRIGAVDYVITLLCTSAQSSGATIAHDPISLTSRLQLLCERVGVRETEDLAAIEAEFFSAANMDRDGLREELQQRTLRSRKAELGMSFFAPRILRAIVTYNAALLERVADEILDSGDWGHVGSASAGTTAPSAQPASLFSCKALGAIAGAVRRRLQGKDPEPKPADRIAWALDLDYLDDPERKALFARGPGTRNDPLGTAILVGLICRSVTVLSVELQTMGISPDEVSGAWIRELDAIFQQEIDSKVSGETYKVAVALSELKNKFLLSPLADNYREKSATKLPQPTRVRATASATPAQPVAAKAREEKQPSARDLVREALEERSTSSGSRKADSTTLGQVPWARFAAIAGLALSLLAAGAFFTDRNVNLARWSGEQLASVSPYLEQGRRNGKGTGAAFVGTISNDWQALSHEGRQDTAETLVTNLRSAGLTQIMIYDRDDTLRVQAVGSQPIQVR